MRKFLRDPYLLLSGALAAIPLLLYQWHGKPGEVATLWSGHLADPAFLLLTIIALLASRRPTTHAEERRFWGLILTTCSLWFAGAVASFVGVALASHETALVPADVFYLCSYATLILSADHRPHLPSGWTRQTPGFGFAVTASLLCVVGIVLYFFALPLLLASGPEKSLSSQATFIALDVLVTIRFVHLLCVAYGTPWASVYGALAISAAAAGVSDGFNLLLQSGRMNASYGTPLDAVWWLPFIALIAARRLRTGQIDRGLVAAPAIHEDPKTGATELLFLYALAFPAAHLVLEALGVLAPTNHYARNLLVLVGLLCFVGLAVGQHRLVERRNRELRSKLRVLVTNEQVVQSQKLEAIGRLAGGLAHDFNNLLTVVQARAEVLLASLAPGRSQHDVEEIRHAAARGAALTHQLLAFSRTQVMRTGPIDLNAAVSEAVIVLRRLAGEPYSIVTELAPGLGPVEAESSQVLQVLLNLVTNARDAMPEGGTITIRTHATVVAAGDPGVVPPSLGGNFAALEVSDSGTGIDAATQLRMFEPFFTSKVGGTGLGLAVVYGIVTQGGGHLSVRSEAGCGTAFTALLPFSARLVSPPQQTASAPGLDTASRCTVLVVEDQQPVREAVHEMLETMGYRVISAADGEEALEICRRADGSLELLLTDVVMPGMRGPELANRVRALRPEIAVVFMSGFVEDVSDAGIASDPHSGFIAKPLTLDALRAKLEEALRNRQQVVSRDRL